MDEVLRDAIAAAYRLGAIRACARFDRVSSSVARIETERHVYWLKLVTRAHRGLDTLESEARIAGELADRGVEVTRAVRRVDGRYAGMLVLADGAVPGVLFDEAPGVEVEAPSFAQAEALGDLLGRLHAASVVADSRWRIDGETLGRAPLRAARAWLERVGGGVARELEVRLAYVDEIVGETTELAWPRGAASLPTGPCHGDVRLENVRFAEGRPTLLDLECIGCGPGAYDLACYWRSRVGLAPAEDAESRRAEWRALLRGYEQVRRLSSSERKAIPALAALRAVWVMALPAEPGTTWGQDWLSDPEYIAAHVSMIERLAAAARAT